MEVPINVQTHPQSMVGKAGKKTKYLHLDIMVGTVDACEILHHQPDSYFNPVFFWEQPTPSINWCNFFSIHCLVVSILCDRFADQPNWFPSECGTTSAPYGEKLDGCDTS